MNASNQNEPADATPEWLQRKERGNLFWMRLMRWISLMLGRRLSRAVLYAIALYFVLTASDSRRASRIYLEKCLGRRATFREVYRHFFCFASTIHDRIYLLNDRHDQFDIRIFGTEPLHVLHAARTGFLLFGAHLGSFEVLRAMAREHPDFRISAVMYPENARQVNRVLGAINPKVMQDIIALGQLDSMITIRDRLLEGAMVGILADRTVRSDHYLSLPFLGTPARFPTGAFRMAAMLRQPVYFMTGLYRGGNRYDIHFELLTDFSAPPAGERNAEVREILANYVRMLEHYCRSAPFNWFNFYDFWEADHRGPD